MPPTKSETVAMEPKIMPQIFAIRSTAAMPSAMFAATFSISKSSIWRCSRSRR